YYHPPRCSQATVASRRCHAYSGWYCRRGMVVCNTSVATNLFLIRFKAALNPLIKDGDKEDCDECCQQHSTNHPNTNSITCRCACTGKIGRASCRERVQSHV